jgi:hypothetical protein
LVDMEIKLRQAQCSNALRALRLRLYARRYLVEFRNVHVTGQRDTGRARGLIDEVGEDIELLVWKYCQAREVLIKLQGDVALKEWRELRDEDVKVNEETENDTAASKKLSRIGSEASRRHAQVSIAKKRHMSWIWTAKGGPDDEEEEMIHEGKYHFIPMHISV